VEDPRRLVHHAQGRHDFGTEAHAQKCDRSAS
jgi:hypothetical protein